MKFWIWISVVSLALLFSTDCFGAKCKVDGVWYDYSSPQCSPERQKPSASLEVEQTKPSHAKGDKKIPFQKDWQDIRPEVVSRCDQLHSSMSLADACQRNEERGFWEMQTDFEMPGEIALSAKIRCSLMHESFSLQAACMRNESKGYGEWMGGNYMPAKYQNAAKTYCSELHESYTLLAACMRNAQRTFHKKYGAQSFQIGQ